MKNYVTFFLAVLILLAAFGASRSERAKPAAEAPAKSADLPSAEVPKPRAEKAARPIAAPAIAAAHASHPKVAYPNPGRIRSFGDPALADAFNVYFSLIGKDRDAYPFGRSGFDTEANAKLALESLKALDYRNLGKHADETFQAAVLAITQLAHSELPSSAEYRNALVLSLAEKARVEGDSPAGKLHRADLKLLAQICPESRLDELSQLYRRIEDPSLRRSFAAGIQANFRQRGRDDSEANTFLRREGIEIPAPALLSQKEEK